MSDFFAFSLVWAWEECGFFTILSSNRLLQITPGGLLPPARYVNEVMMSTVSDPWLQSLFAERIGGINYGKGTTIYKFEKIKRAKRAALAAHPERRLLDFGIGENDDMADEVVRETLKREVDKLENRGYADNGIAAFKEAAAGVMKKAFG